MLGGSFLLLPRKVQRKVQRSMLTLLLADVLQPRHPLL